MDRNYIFLPFSIMWPEENACQSTASHYPTPPRSTGKTLQEVCRASELTELKERIGSNMNRVGMTAQRLRDFLVRVQGNFPTADGSSVKRPERSGTLWEISDIALYESDQLSEIEQYLELLEKIG